VVVALVSQPSLSPLDLLREAQAAAKDLATYTQPFWEVDDGAWVDLHTAIDGTLADVQALVCAARDALDYGDAKRIRALGQALARFAGEEA
jgi:DNA-binding ferritin-like protein